ncbi:MAG: membrane protein insertase YidC [Spirochaetes bacterium]|nr:membrane protein insertase YidC [Spirochaetota bacterium]
MDNKRTILAVVLSAAVLIGWYAIVGPPPVEQPADNTVTEQTQENKKSTEAVKESAVSAVPESNPEIAAVIPENIPEQNFEIATDFYKIILTNKGASVKSLVYGERNIDLTVVNEDLSNKGNFDFALHFTEDDFIKGSSLENSVWAAEKQGDDTYIFSINSVIDGKNVVIQKIFKFNKSEYYFNLTYRILNQGQDLVRLPDGKVIYSISDFLGPRLKSYKGYYGRLYSIYSIKDKLKKANKGGGGGFLGIFGSKKAEPVKSEKAAVEWAGILSRFFVAVMIPQDFKSDSVIWDADNDTGYRTGIVSNLKEISAGSKIENSFRICITEKDEKKLATAAPTLKEANDVNNFIEPIRAFVILFLNFLHKFISNFGWTIVIFSIFTKLIFLPLTHKSTQSMKKMSALAPQINELKTKYKDKPELIQRKTMELYKENQVNPMGGCLPLLVQMPFFIALYSALSNSLGMWDAPWIFWIKDLSSPDAAFSIGGFDINILPLLMTVTTFFQQKMTTMDSGNAQQQMMMKMMPLMMLFIFWSMPSGLILYWIVQNIVQIGHQWLVNKKGK